MDSLDKELLPEYSANDTNRRIMQNYLLWRIVAAYIMETGLLDGERNEFLKHQNTHLTLKASHNRKLEPAKNLSWNAASFHRKNRCVYN